MRRSLPLALIAITLAAACADDRCEGAGCCATSMDCPGWQTCGDGGRCVEAPACTSARDCARGDVCSQNGWCDTPAVLDPARVAILGSIGRDGSAIGAAPVEQPTRIVGALFNQGDVVLHGYAMDGLGRLLYLETYITVVDYSPVLTRSVRRLTPDPWTFEAYMWQMLGPVRPNDEPIPTVCPPASFVGRPGSGDVYYACDDGKAYGPGGALLATGARPVAVTAGGSVLLLMSGQLVVRTPSGQLLTDPSSPGIAAVRAARARGEGFWVVEDDLGAGRARRWLVDANGKLSGGEPLPARTDTGCYEDAIDPEGRVYRPFWTLDDGGHLAAGVERCVPGRCEEVYAGPRPDEGPLFEAPTRPPQRSIHPMPPYPSLVSGP